MRQFFFTNFAIVIPLLVLFIKTWMKHTIGQKVDEISYFDFLLDLPIDLLFISISMNITYLLKANLINSSENIKWGLLMLIIHIAVALLSIFIWRFAKVLFKERDNFIGSACLGAANFFIVGFIFHEIVQLILL